ncbi:ATP synthase regulation protein NCA2-domain-containing protein [Peziza echinospora]|nr:ATP synthase regulation protein NCA2-domain-containing protein [Peziza echinospora]
MSFIPDQLRNIDHQLDRLQVDYPSTEPGTPSNEGTRFDGIVRSARVERLKSAIVQLTTAIGNASGSNYTTPERLLYILADIPASPSENDLDPQEPQAAYERKLEWLLLTKATVLLYGIVFRRFLEQTLPLSEDLFYWNEVLSSSQYTALYAVQTAPYRLFQYSSEIYQDAMERFRASRGFNLPSNIVPSQAPRPVPSVASLKRFYELVRNSIRDRTEDLQKRVFVTSPISILRHDMRTNQASVRRLREQHATAIGILEGEALSLYGVENPKEEWKDIVEKGIFLIGNIIRHTSYIHKGTLEEFELSILEATEANTVISPTAHNLGRIKQILETDLPAQARASQQLIHLYGRPGLIVRYWAPATVLLLSSTKILKILVRRQADLKEWAHESVITLLDFWKNWIVEPVKNVIGTIRHDAGSEVALMGRRSLDADMESLERMVVDFAIDNPQASSEHSSITPQELDLIRQNVKEGDLSLVLRAYENDLRSPFKGAIRGELVRALLIQIQKTKVDVEVAVTGIDRLLKSQELVFGLVGLTPGILATWGVVRWLGGAMGGRKGTRKGRKSEEMLTVLRHIDRILSSSTQKETLLYKEHGLLLCEMVVLRELAKNSLPKHIYGEFAEEMNDLANIHIGIYKQQRVVDRVKWAYAKWIH